jgi:hypothetical protein
VCVGKGGWRFVIEERYFGACFFFHFLAVRNVYDNKSMKKDTHTTKLSKDENVNFKRHIKLRFRSD